MPAASKNRLQAAQRRSESNTLHSAARPLSTKLAPPQLPHYCVDRDEHLTLLDHAVSRSLTLVSAPAGSGKTTLLTQWYEKRRKAMPIAWLSLDDFDNAPRLFTHLSAALKTAGIALSECPMGVTGFLAALDEQFGPLTGSVGGTNVVVLLDNAQTLHGDAAVQLRFVIAQSPACVRWVLAGRGMPNLHSDAFALRDQLSCIGGADLNGNVQFIEQLARKLDLPSLPSIDLTKLLEKTGGWLGGIKLALKSTPEQSQDATLDYFSSILDTQPAHLRRFILACATVDQLNASLANALQVNEDGQTLLEESFAAQLYLSRSEGDYRFTTLFLNFLRRTALHEMPDDLRALHLRASRWYAEQHRFTESLRHATLCGNDEWRLDLLARAVRGYVKIGAIDQALALSESLPSAELFAREALWTTHIAALILSRQFSAATLVLQQAAIRHSTDTLVGCTIPPKLQTLRLMLSLLSGRVRDEDADGCPLETDADVYLSGTLMNLQAYWLLQQRKFDAAQRRALQARDLLLEQGNLYGATHANTLLCAALGNTAQYDAVLAHSERIFAIAESGPHNTAWANAATTLAQVRYEQNRLREAEALCVEALPKLATISSMQAFAAGNIVLARVHAARNEFHDSWRLLDELHGYLETRRSKYLLAQVCYEKIRLCLLNDRGAEADKIASEFSLNSLETQQAWNAENLPAFFLDATLSRLGCAQAYRLFYAGHQARCQTILRTLIADAANLGYVQRLIALESLYAVSLHEAHDTPAATAALQRAFALTRDHGFTRSVFDDTPLLYRLVASAADNGKMTLPAKYVDKFADVFGAKSATPRTVTRRSIGPPVEPLTDRERAVLRLLSLGLTNQEICIRSNIALTTAKWHLKNIFAKLDVGSRTAALARARALQLIE